MHRRVFVDDRTGERLEGRCLADRPHRPVVLTIEPAEVVAWLTARGQVATAIPPLSPRCKSIPQQEPPRILSPDAATPYVVRADAPVEHQQVALTARVAPGVERLYWYQDGVLVGSGPPGEPVFVSAEPGPHRLVVVDDGGRSDRVVYRVE
jgi:penicillin-binding protein 1C